MIQDGLDRNKLNYVVPNGIRTRYYDAGHGEPIVLFHGGHFGTLYSLDAWSLNLSPLTQHFRVIAFDKLGQGYTDNPQADTGYTFSNTLQHAKDFLDSIGVSKAHLVGHSRGGLLVARLAMTSPELARSLTIIDSGTLAPDHPNHDIAAFYDDLEKRRVSIPSTEEIVRLEPEAQSYNYDHITENFVDRMLEIAHLPKTDAAHQRLLALNDAVWQPDLIEHRKLAWATIKEQGFSQPSLLIWGAQDPSSPLEISYPLYEQMANSDSTSDFHIFNQTGHYVFRERYREFNNLLVHFCKLHDDYRV